MTADYGLRTDGLIALSFVALVISSSASIVVPRGQPGDDLCRFHEKAPNDALLGAYA